MATSVLPLSTHQDFFSSRGLHEEEDTEEEEEEEDVVVKSKPVSSRPEQLVADEEEERGRALEEVIEDSPLPPPNGGSSVYNRVPMLDLADVPLHGERGDAIGTSTSWTSTATASTGEFGLSGQFKVQGKRCTLRLEDDALQWSWGVKSKEFCVSL